MSASYVPRSPALNDAIEKFHHAFVDMLVGKTDERKFVSKPDMYKVLKAAHLVNTELETCDAETPTFDPLLDELKLIKPLYDHPQGNVPVKGLLNVARQFIPPSIMRKLDSPPISDLELMTGGTTKVRGTGKDSTARTTTVKPTSTKPPAITKPATKTDISANGPTTTNAAGVTKTPKSKPIVKPAPDAAVKEKIQPQPIKKKAVTYVKLYASDESTGDEDEGEGEDEEESGQEEKEEEVEVREVKPARRKVVKSAAVITDEMDEAAAAGKEIEWSLADKQQADKDAAWTGFDRKDPCWVDGKDLRYGPLYWGLYSTPLAKPGPIPKEKLQDRTLNPLDREGHAKYILADVYETPCRQCVGSKTQAKECVSARGKPNPLGATVEEEKERASACASCRHNKRRSEDHSRARSRQIVPNPFHDHTTVTKGGSGKGKVKTEKATPAAKGAPAAKRASRKPVVDNDPSDGKQTEAIVTPASKTRGSRRAAADDDLPNGKLESRIASLEKTCQDLAKKVSDMDGSMRKVIKTNVDKMTLDIRQLEQAHKSTKAYVEQKTCTAMEALGELGNAVHETLENMMEVLDEVPQELREALQSIAGGAAGEDADSALEGIRSMQSRWAYLADLVEGLLPRSMQVGAVARASHTPTPPQDVTIALADVSPQNSMPTAPAATIAEALPSLDATMGNDKVDIDMAEVGQGEEEDEPAPELDDQPTPIQQNGTDIARSIDRDSQTAAGVDGLSDLTVDSSASPPEQSLAKRKLDDNAEDAPTEKKKKRGAAPKKKGGRRKGRGKVAEADLATAEPEDQDAEGEVEA